MKPWLRIPLLVLASPLIAAAVAILLVFLLVFTVVEIVVAALENRRPVLPPATNPDGTHPTWREFILDQGPWRSH